jgi:hypothetical protein
VTLKASVIRSLAMGRAEIHQRRHAPLYSPGAPVRNKPGLTRTPAGHRPWVQAEAPPRHEPAE